MFFLFGENEQCYSRFISLIINPFTARVFDRVLWGDSNYWVYGRNPMMWPFKWKLSACTYTWCYLFFKISQNEIWTFGWNLLVAKFGSERVNTHFFHGNIWTYNWPAPNASGFIAQLVEHRTGIARSRVQSPLKSLIFFFSGYFT